MVDKGNTVKNSPAGKPVLKTIWRVISVIFSILFVICIVLVLLITISGRNENGVNIGPYRIAVVLSGSMEPAIKTGSLIVTKSVPDGSLVKGDVITFMPQQGDSILLTHRIIDINIEDNSFITQGDASDIPDSNPVSYDRILGKVIFAVPIVGHVLLFLKTPRGIIGLIAFIAVFEILRHIIQTKMKASNKNINGDVSTDIEDDTDESIYLNIGEDIDEDENWQ